MAGVQFGNVGGDVKIGTMAGRDIIQKSSLDSSDKAHLHGLQNQLEQTLEAKEDGWQTKTETLLAHMVNISKEVAIKLIVAVVSKRLGG